MSEELRYDLKHCPLCGGRAKLVDTLDRIGYGEYERHPQTLFVLCESCGARGGKTYPKCLADFSEHTVADFRANPALRARVEDEWEQYLAAQKAAVVAAWNQRPA